MIMNREKVSTGFMNGAVNELQKQLCKRINEKGDGSFRSSHEILGVIIEQVDELIESVRRRREVGETGIKAELFDIALACVFGAACIAAGTLDW